MTAEKTTTIIPREVPKGQGDNLIALVKDVTRRIEERAEKERNLKAPPLKIHPTFAP